MGSGQEPMTQQAAIIVTWNASKWTPDGRDDLPLILALQGNKNVVPFVRSWSVGARKAIDIGTAVFLLRLGSERGILARGETVTEIFEDEHWGDAGGVARYVLIRFHDVVSVQDRLPIESLVEKFPSFPWMNLQQSGLELRDTYFESCVPGSWHSLDQAWDEHLTKLQR